MGLKIIYVLRNFPLYEFTQRLMKGGGISAKRIFLLMVYYIQIILSLPFDWLSAMIIKRKIRNTQITIDPIFILGHYRSGTSLLQKLMISDRRFGYLNYYDALFPNVSLLSGRILKSIFQWHIHKFKIKNPFFHNTVLQFNEPDEEDDYLMNKGSPFSAYWGMVFPKRWKDWLNGSRQMADENYMTAWKNEYLKTIRLLTYKNNGQQLVLKSPPNTERIKILSELFPQAKFIFIFRNPVDIYFSTLNMWENVVLKYYSLQNLSKLEINNIIFGHFEYLTDQYEKDKGLIPDSHLVEVSYESLKKDPFKTICDIYRQLHLPDFIATSEVLKRQIEKESSYINFDHKMDNQTLEEISIRWGRYFQKWGYEKPGKSHIAGQQTTLAN